MPTVKSMMDKLEGATSKAAMRTIDRQRDRDVWRSEGRKEQGNPPPDECDWRRLCKTFTGPK